MNIVRKRKNISSNEKLPGVSGFWDVEVTEKKSRDTTKLAKVELKSKKPRLTGAEQYKKFIDEEDRIRKVEDELANVNSNPTTPDQFERILMMDKNNSFIWIKYMAFFLDTAEVAKARSIAKKAIVTINFREENELLNVWMAYLNLEIRFGSMDTFREILRDATQRNDSFKVYTRTLKILLETEKFDDVNKIIDILRKKHRPNPEMWLEVAEAYLQMKNEKVAKEMLPKSLLSLKEQDRKFNIYFLCFLINLFSFLDVPFMVKYALMTSRYNLHEFSQTIFEKILSSYKKKLPIWFQYIDLMVKSKEIAVARSLFERLILVELPLKKMKTVFQKYIDFETKHEPANVSKVKKSAKLMLKQLKTENDDNEME